jgi:hypothetical protein
MCQRHPREQGSLTRRFNTLGHRSRDHSLHQMNLSLGRFAGIQNANVYSDILSQDVALLSLISHESQRQKRNTSREEVVYWLG